jgi:hypothetical protein
MWPGANGPARAEMDTGHAGSERRHYEIRTLALLAEDIRAWMWID